MDSARQTNNKREAISEKEYRRTWKYAIATNDRAHGKKQNTPISGFLLYIGHDCLFSLQINSKEMQDEEKDQIFAQVLNQILKELFNF